MCPDHALSVSKLVVAVDGSWQSTTAVKLASEVAKGLAAELTILHVIPSAEERPPVAGAEGARLRSTGEAVRGFPSRLLLIQITHRSLRLRPGARPQE